MTINALDVLRRRHAAWEIDDDDVFRLWSAGGRTAGPSLIGVRAGIMLIAWLAWHSTRRAVCAWEGGARLVDITVGAGAHRIDAAGRGRMGGRMSPRSKDLERLRRYWDKHSRSYDRQMGFFDRRVFGDTRQWVCRQAVGDVLEVAVGTGLNLDSYPGDVRITGIDLSPEMLAHARRRADASGRDLTLQVGDAQRLQFPNDSFDTVICTFSLCAIPDDHAAVGEMWRVLRPGGLLLLADHVVSTSAPVRALQRLLEVVTIPIGGENFRRRPINHLRERGFTIERQERFKLGIVERVAARKPRS